MQYLTFVSIALLCLIGCVADVEISGEHYVFAFLTWADDVITMWGIDPSEFNEKMLLATIPIPDEYNSVWRQLSPDGKWLGLSFGSTAVRFRGRGISIMNLQGGETIDFFKSEGPLLQGDTFFEWSPDSHHLAFNATSDDDPKGASAYVYSIQDDTLIALDTKGYPTHAAWTRDGSRLTVLSWIRCDNPEASCNDFNFAFNFLETFRVSDGRREHVTTQINDIVGEPCKFDWSPDNRWLSFEIDCTNYYEQYVHDIYIWDVENDTVTPLTTHTAMPGRPILEKGSQRTIYHSLWYDSMTMLVGERVFPLILLTTDSHEDILIRTAVYTWPDSDVRELSSKTAADWTVNPVTGELAFRLEAMEPVPDDDEIMDWAWTEVSVHIAAFEDDAMEITMDAPPGCNLKWSLDGKYLAYEDSDSLWNTLWHCRGEEDIKGFIFIERETGQISRYHLEEEGSVIPLGWVAIAK